MKKIHIPEDQKKALVQAILTLLSVLFGIALTLASQAVDQLILNPAPPIAAYPGLGSANGDYDEMQTLGSTHFTDIYVDNLDADTALTAQTATITGTLTAEQLTTSAGVTVGDTLTVTDNAAIGGSLDVQGGNVTP